MIYLSILLVFLNKFRCNNCSIIFIFIINSSNIVNIFFMPQLVPFYFVNQVTFAAFLLLIVIYVFSKYILPRFVRLFLARTFISKL